MILSHNKIPSLVAGLTLLAGIVPFVSLTARAHTFWFNGRVDSPLIAVPSVWLGDLVFLPWLFVRIARFLQLLHVQQARGRLRISLAPALALALTTATMIAGCSHYLWTQDAYLGFIDPMPGALSLVGWWHFGFTVFAMTTVFVFLIYWWRASGLYNQRAVALYGFEVWRIFRFYALLSIADFVVFHLFVLPRRLQHDYTILTAWSSLLIIPFAFGVGELFQGRVTDPRNQG